MPRNLCGDLADWLGHSGLTGRGEFHWGAPTMIAGGFSVTPAAVIAAAAALMAAVAASVAARAALTASMAARAAWWSLRFIGRKSSTRDASFLAPHQTKSLASPLTSLCRIIAYI